MTQNSHSLVTAALPYANGPLHLGHIAGAYLPSDIYVRYLRAQNRDVAFVCGSDEYGAAITVRALQEETTPQAVVDKYHEINEASFKELGIEFDIYSRTTTPSHIKTTQTFFKGLIDNGHIEEAVSKQWYCPHDDMFLPDRYVEGLCPHCDAEGARGDQCDACGKTIDAASLKTPQCKICSRTPELKETKHWFLKLGDFQESALAYIESHPEWRDNVVNFSKNLLSDGLHSRCITRDLKWGVPVPVEGSDGKVIYVWFDAPIGYVTFTKQLFEKRNDPDGWKRYWLKSEGADKIIHFIGKDNTVFHAVMWPIMLSGCGGDYAMPTDVVANEFLNFKGEKFSKSKGSFITVQDYAAVFEPDTLRFCLTAIAPEGRDTDFTWEEYQRRNNEELGNCLGNFIHRVLTFGKKHLSGVVPEKPNFTEADKELLAMIEAVRTEMATAFDGFKFKQALQSLMRLASAGNSYFDSQEPWKTRKTDEAACERAMYVCLQLVASLSVLGEPIMPHTMPQVRSWLGVESAEWKNVGENLVAPKTEIGDAKVLFKRIDEEALETGLEEMKKEK